MTGDDADAADDVDYMYPIPNEESVRVMPDTGPEVKIPVKYFGFHADNFGPSRWFGHPINGKPRCRSCYKEILYKFGNTSRPKLFNHLKDKHPKLFDLLLIIKLFQMQIQNTAPGLIYSLLKCLFTNLLHHLLTYYYNSTRNHLAFRCAV